MIITIDTGDAVIIDEKHKPKVIVGGQSDMMDWAKRIKAHCAATTKCTECIFHIGAGEKCKLEPGGLPDSWEV